MIMQTQWILCKLIYHRRWILIYFEMLTNTQHIRWTFISHVKRILSTVFFYRRTKSKGTERERQKKKIQRETSLFVIKFYVKMPPKSLHGMLTIRTSITPIDTLDTSYCYGLFIFHYPSGHSATDAYFSMWTKRHTQTSKGKA